MNSRMTAKELVSRIIQEENSPSVAHQIFLNNYPLLLLGILFSVVFLCWIYVQFKNRKQKGTNFGANIALAISGECLLLSSLPFVINSIVFDSYSSSIFTLIKNIIQTLFSVGLRGSSSYLTIMVTTAILLSLYFVEIIVFINFVRNMIKRNKNKNTYSQGSARWATKSELIKSQMATTNPKGICFAQTNDAKAIEMLGTNQKFKYERLGKELLCDDTAYHTLVIGGTGSYKGVSVAIPSLLTWKESVIFVDPKGESYDLTSGWRSQFSNVYYFNPADSGKSCHLNPLDFVPKTKDAATEIGKIVHMIHPDQSKDAYWDKVPRMMLEMLFGYILLQGERKSIPEAAELLFSGDGKGIFSKVLSDSAESIQVFNGSNETTRWTPKLPKSDPLYALQNMVVANAQLFMEMASGQDSQQITTHLTTVKTDLDTYIKANEVMDTSDFSLDDICDNERPISLYLCIPVSELQAVMPMFKLIYTLILKHLLSGPQKHKHRLLLGLDEFSQFKKFEVIAEQLPFVRSYGIKIMAFIQSISQLDEWYGHDGRKAMMDNFQMKIFLKADENETLQYFENKLGKSTELKKSVSFGSNRKEMGISSSNESVSEVGRSLLTAQELGQLPLHESIVFSPEIPPYRACKIQYFSDPRFNNRINLPIDKSKQPQWRQVYPTVLSKKELEDIHKYNLRIIEEEEERALQTETFNSVIDEIISKARENAENKDPAFESSDEGAILL